MDFLNTAFAQIGDLFRSMTLGARITAALLLTVVVVSMAWMFQHQVSGGGTYLFGGQSFSPGEMNAMQAAFSQKGLGDFELEGSRIRIPRQQQAAYVAALADAKALPANWNEYLSRALDSNNPLISSQEREKRLEVAVQQDLSLILSDMDGVDKASVHYDSQKKPGFGRERVATASVTIKMIGGRNLDEERVQMIREMVAGCFAGLRSEQVIVSDLNGRVFSTPGSDGLGGSGGMHRYITTKAAFQKEYERSIKNALAYVPGVTVAVNVELETELRKSTRTTKYDPKPTIVERREEDKSVESESAPRGGAPGLNAQQPPQQLNQPTRISESARGATSKEKGTVTEERNVVNSESTEMEEIGLTPRIVRVSVGVPRSYFEDVWRHDNPTPEGQTPPPPDPKALADIEKRELENIQSHVVPLIPKPADIIDPTPLVTVRPFTEIAQPAIPAPGVAPQALSWLAENWQTLGLAGLVLVSLVMVRSMVRATPPVSKSLEFSLPPMSVAAEEEVKKEAPAENAKSRLKRKVASGVSLREELVDMVREDPDTAANILRGWIGTGN